MLCVVFLVKLCRQNIWERSNEGLAACLPDRHRPHQGRPRPAGPVSSVWRHCVSQRLLSGAGLVLLPQHPVLCLKARELPPGGGQQADDEHGQGGKWRDILKLFRFYNWQLIFVLYIINFLFIGCFLSTIQNVLFALFLLYFAPLSF